VLFSIAYDHLRIAPSSGYPRTTVDPVTLELELGHPAEWRFTSRLAVGMGIYFRQEPRPPVFAPAPVPVSGAQPVLFETRVPAGQRFGTNFGAGLSIPLWKNTMMDLDARYHQTVGAADASVVVATVTAGLRFLIPGHEPDPEGYVSR
jgi:hypothetical protein